MMWARWSLRAQLHVRWTDETAPHQPGLRDLVRQFDAPGLTLSFDIRSVVGPAHWQANVHKADAKVTPLPQATTDFARRILELHDFDVELKHASRKKLDPMRQGGFSVAAHEFGHTIGYSNPRGHLDEYDQKSRYYNDVHSIMNIGRRLRARHLSLITETLDKMVPACRFRARVEHE